MPGMRKLRENKHNRGPLVLRKRLGGVLLLFMIASIVACGYFVAQMGMVVLRVFGLLYACLKVCAHC